ncbi:MAG: Ig-like domain-containing protein [Gammaproteobacteria bacterium]
MKSIARLFALVSVAVTLGLPLAGCEPGNPSPFSVPTLQSLAATPATVTLTTGDTQALAVTGTFSDGSTEPMTARANYSSSNTAVATVSAAGVITAVGAGTATVQVTAAGGAGAASASYAVPVTVTAPVPVSLLVEPRTATVTVGGTQALAVTATYPNASTGALTTGLTWSSANTAVATVSAAGTVTGVAAGTTTITATHTPSGRASSMTITVVQAALSYSVLDFRTPGVNYALTPFGGEQAVLTSSGVPAGGPAGQVAKITRAAGSECWAGTTMSIGDQFSIGRLPFSATATTMTVRLHVPATGMSIKLKVEDATNGGVSVETDVVSSVVGWQTLTFDFSRQTPGTAALNPASTYNKISIFPNFSCPAAGPSADEVFYVDEVRFLGAAAPSAPPLSPPQANSYAVLDFNTAGVTYTLTPFGGIGAELTAAGVPASGPSGQVAKLTRPVSAECWSGTTMSVGGSFSIGRLPFSASATTMTVQLYSPAAGPSIKLKVEDAGNAGVSVETDQPAVAGWQTLTFNFANPTPGTAALNTANTYNKVSIFPGFSCGGTAASSEQVFYVGPVTFLGAAAPSAPPL